MAELRKVVIVGSNRIPFVRAHSLYAEESNLTMLSAALAGLVERYGLTERPVGEVMAGAVLSHSRDFNLAREAALDAGLVPTTSATTLQMACGTSLQAALLLGAKIATGEIDSGIAAGTDTISDAPLVFGSRFQHRALALSRARTLKERLAALKGFTLGELAPVAPSTTEPRTGLSMGEHCELMARDWGIARRTQDEWALRSHRNATAAIESGFHDDLVTPFAGVHKDMIVRPETSIDALAALPPAFDRRSGHGTLTAGNSTALTDGAAAVLLASEDWARQAGLPILARLSMGQTAGTDFAGGQGLLMAPTLAVSRLLARAGIGFDAIDLFELHEAFAAQVLATLNACESADYCRDVLGRPAPLGPIDPARINVLGSSLAYGHPFAATGARILGLTAKLVQSRAAGRALISICTAGGMGVAALVERAD